MLAILTPIFSLILSTSNFQHDSNLSTKTSPFFHQILSLYQYYTCLKMGKIIKLSPCLWKHAQWLLQICSFCSTLFSQCFFFPPDFHGVRKLLICNISSSMMCKSQPLIIMVLLKKSSIGVHKDDQSSKCIFLSTNSYSQVWVHSFQFHIVHSQVLSPRLVYLVRLVFLYSKLHNQFGYSLLDPFTKQGTS